MNRGLHQSNASASLDIATQLFAGSGPEWGIRTLGTRFSAYKGLANLTTFLTRSENFGLYYIPQAVKTRLSRSNWTRFDLI